MSDDFDSEFCENLYFEMRMFVRSTITTKTYKLNEMINMVSHDKYPMFHKLLNGSKNLAVSKFQSTPVIQTTTSGIPDERSINPSMLKFKGNSFPKFLIDLEKHIGKKDLKRSIDLCDVPAGLRGDIEDPSDLFGYLKNNGKPHLSLDNITSLYNVLEELDNRVEIMKVVFQHFELSG